MTKVVNLWDPTC